MIQKLELSDNNAKFMNLLQQTIKNTFEKKYLKETENLSKELEDINKNIYIL